jgi:hypothetical protein
MAASSALPLPTWETAQDYNAVMALRQTAPSARIAAKEEAEAANFKAFLAACPNFVGRPLADIQRGGDPPDFLCLDVLGMRIGVELMQWINEQQIGRSKQLYRLEESYTRVTRSWSVQPPDNIGRVLIYAKGGRALAPPDSTVFHDELYRLVADVDAAWLENPDRRNPQGYDCADFTTYPSLASHLDGLCFYSRERFDVSLGIDWLTFRVHGGAYTSDWMRDTLIDNILHKVAKYAKPHNKIKLEHQRLSEFYLLAYYDEALLHNTPYDAPGFGFREIGALVSGELSRKPHPFDKVFLYSPLEAAAKVLQLWPAR